MRHTVVVHSLTPRQELRILGDSGVTNQARDGRGAVVKEPIPLPILSKGTTVIQDEVHQTPAQAQSDLTARVVVVAKDARYQRSHDMREIVDKPRAKPGSAQVPTAFDESARGKIAEVIRSYAYLPECLEHPFDSDR